MKIIFSFVQNKQRMSSNIFISINSIQENITENISHADKLKKILKDINAIPDNRNVFDVFESFLFDYNKAKTLSFKIPKIDDLYPSQQKLADLKYRFEKTNDILAYLEYVRIIRELYSQLSNRIRKFIKIVSKLKNKITKYIIRNVRSFYRNIIQFHFKNLCDSPADDLFLTNCHPTSKNKFHQNLKKWNLILLKNIHLSY